MSSIPPLVSQNLRRGARNTEGLPQRREQLREVGCQSTAPPLLFSSVPAPFFLANKVVFFFVVVPCLFLLLVFVCIFFFSFSGKHSEMLVHQAQDLKYFDV